ncbi:hypothetical protein L195_g016013 [Trifolium pratense]|uniref:Uncharacterized protein n=1 Tax=Trifolium pratense TaxID=57577 RepID=A0A2K3MPY0_TRIPR|nr:hypothetical protein L195_g016013 [Trifolium pratense]
MQQGFLNHAKMFERFLVSYLPFIKSTGDTNHKVQNALYDVSDRYYAVGDDLSMLEADLAISVGNEAVLEDEIHRVKGKLFQLLKKK